MIRDDDVLSLSAPLDWCASSRVNAAMAALLSGEDLLRSPAFVGGKKKKNGKMEILGEKLRKTKCENLKKRESSRERREERERECESGGKGERERERERERRRERERERKARAGVTERDEFSQGLWSWTEGEDPEEKVGCACFFFQLEQLHPERQRNEQRD